MTVTIKRVTAGTGYRYLMQSVTVGDGDRLMSSPLTRYYAESGNPPGRWLGSGLARLDAGSGLTDGSVVTEKQMFNLFGMGTDPVSGEALGVRPYRTETSPTEDSKKSRRRQPVAGFDLTFSVPKSVSAWWGIADAGIQSLIADAHYAALTATLRLIERDVAATRIGSNGVAQVECRGIIAAAFDHWDSRANDPHLHTHVVVANRVQGLDGKWRTLDSRALYKATVALSETYHGLLADQLSARLGVGWDPRPRRHSPVPAWEIAGVPDQLIAAFSQRSHTIEDTTNAMIADYRRRHGRAPTAKQILALRQQATLDTRPDKKLHSLAELTSQWRERATAVLGTAAPHWARTVPRTHPNAWLRADDLDAKHLDSVASTVVAVVAEKRATWSRWNLHAEAARQLMGYRFASPDDRDRALTTVVDATIAASITLSPPELTHTPKLFRRTDGSSAFRHRHAELYTCEQLLAAEARLLAVGRDTSGPRIPLSKVDAIAAANLPGRDYPLTDDQTAARPHRIIRPGTRRAGRGRRNRQVQRHGRTARGLGSRTRTRLGHRPRTVGIGRRGTRRRARPASGEHR